MKIATEREEFKNMGPDELQVKIDSMRRESFSLRLNASTAHVKDYSQYGKLRRRIARALTYLQTKSLESRAIGQ